MSEHWTKPARLQEGMVILTGGERYRVDLVNYSRARCVPLEKRATTIVDKVMGKERTFEKFGGSINISPNAECKILGMITDEQFKRFTPTTAKARIKAAAIVAKGLKAGTTVMVTLQGVLTKATFIEWSQKYPGYATVEVQGRRSPRKIREILTEERIVKPTTKTKGKNHGKHGHGNGTTGTAKKGGRS